MFDVVKAAMDRRNELRVEIAKLDEFMRLAREFTEMAEKKVQNAPAVNQQARPEGKPIPIELKQPSGKPILDTQSVPESTPPVNGKPSLFRGAFLDSTAQAEVSVR